MNSRPHRHEARPRYRDTFRTLVLFAVIVSVTAGLFLHFVLLVQVGDGDLLIDVDFAVRTSLFLAVLGVFCAVLSALMSPLGAAVAWDYISGGFGGLVYAAPLLLFRVGPDLAFPAALGIVIAGGFGWNLARLRRAARAASDDRAFAESSP